MITIQPNAPVGTLTTFGLPATAAALATWETEDDLLTLAADPALPRPLKALGGGSNLLFTRPFEGTLLHRGGEPSVRFDGLLLRADTSAILDNLCAKACDAGLRGMENLSGIPGTLGGALVQNAGAYGAETGDLLVSARLFDLKERRFFDADRRWFDYSYRSSRLKAEGGRYVIISATLRLEPKSAPARLGYGNLRQVIGDADPTPEAVRRAVITVRDSKLPSPDKVGSAGSFFRNPEVDPAMLTPDMPRYILPSGLAKVPAAWLIDRTGLKGSRCGGAAVWESQPLVIVNAEGRATAADVINLENHIVRTVSDRFGITLIPEVEHL